MHSYSVHSGIIPVTNFDTDYPTFEQKKLIKAA